MDVPVVEKAGTGVISCSDLWRARRYSNSIDRIQRTYYIIIFSAASFVLCGLNIIFPSLEIR